MPQPRIALGLDRFSGLYIWAGFILLFSVWVPNLFLTSTTVHSVASQQAIAAMMALAILIPISAGAFDLSVGATINLSTILVIQLQTVNGWDMWPAILFTIVVAAVVGCINGLIVVKLRVNSFIATLGSGSIIIAVQSIVSGQAQPLPPTDLDWLNLTQTTVFGFQVVVIYLLVLGVFVWWLLDHTPFGRYLYAIGGNAEAARLSGVRVGAWTWTSLVLSATICGVAGVLYGSLFGPALTYGGALMLPAFAAVFLGSTQLKPGRFNVWGTLLAVYVLATGVKGLQLVTGVQWLNEMFSGVALILAVAFAGWRQRAVKKVVRRRDATSSPPRPEDGLDAKHPELTRNL